MRLRAILFIAASLAFAGAVHATQPSELYAVAVHEGRIRTDGQLHGPRVDVVIDRPGARVSLALGSHEPVRWLLKTTPGTEIDRIVLHGSGRQRAEVSLDGQPYAGPLIVSELGSTHRSEGERFRAVVGTLPQLVGLAKLDGFVGRYKAPEEPFRIDGPNRTEASLDPDYLDTLVRPDAVPEEFRDALTAEPARDLVQFTDEGFSVTTAEGEVTSFPVSLDVPPISSAAGAAMDERGGRLFGVSVGGEGFLYQYDIAAGRWSALASMEGDDHVGLLYDEAGDRLIMGSGILPGSTIAIYDFKGGRQPLKLRVEALPGFTDLYDVGNGPMPALRPVAVSGNLALFRSDDRHWRRQTTSRTRTYLVDLAAQTAVLVDYRD